MMTAMTSMIGAARRSKAEAATTSKPRLSMREERGHDVDLHVALSQGEDEPQHLFGQVLRERDDHSVDGVTLDDVDDLIRLAENRNSFGSASTKPTRLIRYSGC